MTTSQTTPSSTAQKITKSELFSVYNSARQAARQGKLDQARVNRALGYLQSGKAQEKWAEYNTTTKTCDCPDHTYRHQTCKHMVALMIAVVVDRRRKAAAA